MLFLLVVCGCVCVCMHLSVYACTLVDGREEVMYSSINYVDALVICEICYFIHRHLNCYTCQIINIVHVSIKNNNNLLKHLVI